MDKRNLLIAFVLMMIVAVAPSLIWPSKKPVGRPGGRTADSVAVHDSQQSWETFRDSILLPRMQAGIEGGFTAPPEERVFEIVNEVRD